MKTDPTIYFICPTNRSASGGVKQMYRQAEILNEAGYNTVVLHRKIGRKERWFQNDVIVKYAPYLFKRLKYDYKNKEVTIFKKLSLGFLQLISHRFTEDAILVFPEIYGPRIHKIAPNNKRVIFNQNCYYTFDHFSLEGDYKDSPYQSPQTLATLVASEDAKSYFKFAFPKINVSRMRLGIDKHIFHYSPAKKKQFCFMPRKLGSDVTQVINILQLRGLQPGWSFYSIEGKTELEVASIMKESMIFLSFNHREGFGLPPVEAMACGCYVIGYVGQGGKEYFLPEFSRTVEEGDIIGYVKAIEETISKFESYTDEMIEHGRSASEFVLEKYSTDNEKRDTLAIWKNILDLYHSN